MSDEKRKQHPMARLSLGCLLTSADIEKSAARAARGVSNWQPILTYRQEDRGETVIVATQYGAVGEAQLFPEGWYWANTDPSDYYDSRVDGVTHWMPLPEPPQEGG